MRASELTALVGHTGTITLHGLTIAVVSLDAKVSFGGVNVLVRPVDERSSGETWVAAKQVKWEATV